MENERARDFVAPRGAGARRLVLSTSRPLAPSKFEATESDSSSVGSTTSPQVDFTGNPAPATSSRDRRFRCPSFARAARRRAHPRTARCSSSSTASARTVRSSSASWQMKQTWGRPEAETAGSRRPWPPPGAGYASDDGEELHLTGRRSSSRAPPKWCCEVARRASRCERTAASSSAGRTWSRIPRVSIASRAAL